jgi:DNA-binding LacI/PurR family transcriptional regulator
VRASTRGGQGTRREARQKEPGRPVAPSRGSAVGRPVMADVARLAGVSHQTVSRVLNDHPNVRQQTREDVLAAIRELGYRRNAAARTLVTGRTNTIGVISFDTTLYGPASMLYGIERAAHPSYSVAIASLQRLDRSSMLAAAERFLNQGVEGIIVIAPHATAVRALLGIAPDVPLVGVGCGISAPLPSVAIDNPAGAARATRYLLDLGHRTVHHVGGPAHYLDGEERIEGWRVALETAGARQPSVLRGDWSARSGYEIGHQLVDMPEVTAVFSANDQMALGLLRAFAERGRSVPEEISVVGFDDIPEAAYFRPPLTTVRQDFGELGRRALHLLIDGIAGDQAAVRAGGASVTTGTYGIPGARPTLPIAPELIVRGSAIPPCG